MAVPTPKWSAGRSGFGLYELLVSWWQHRASFLISLSVTLAALLIYFFSFFGESPTPIFGFLERLEDSSLDMRFLYRPASATPVDPRIVIVDIDQHTQEVLGKWPFSECISRTCWTRCMKATPKWRRSTLRSANRTRPRRLYARCVQTWKRGRKRAK